MRIQPEQVVSVPGAWERDDPAVYSAVEGLQPQAPQSSALLWPVSFLPHLTSEGGPRDAAVRKKNTTNTFHIFIT